MSSAPWIWSHKCNFGSSMVVAHTVMGEVLQQLAQRGWGERDLFAVEMALEEAFANAVHHGNHDDPEKKISFSCQLSENLVRFQIEDEGEGFDPDFVPDPRDSDHLDQVSGRGVCLIFNFMSRVTYSECGKQVTLEKDRTREK
ncbi:MAG: ATP-binding protein [Planctomycetaceae bacterium]|nr:ATP-binding protein [Planctomycetaceae bacterium]